MKALPMLALAASLTAGAHATVEDGLSGTHKSWWECDSGIAYLVSGAPGWRAHRMMRVYDLSDPARPRFIRDFGLPGQQPGARGPVPTGGTGRSPPAPPATP